MQVLCPNCSNSITVNAEAARAEVHCPSCGSSFHVEPDATTEWRPPQGQTQLGRFVLLETIGAGAFGTVYRARDPQLDRIVAIKVPRAGSLTGPQDLDRFLREARSVAQLRHSGIVPVLDVGTHEGLPYLVCDFVKGITLADLMTGKRPAPHDAAALIAEIADILQYAHDQGVIHRDVKPSNIMLRDEERGARDEGGGASGASLAPRPSSLTPVLMDFGLAKRDAGETSMTMDGQVLGTPAYMSPEQARGEAKKVDGRSDVYSLGVVLYQIVTGELPFRGNTRMLLHQVLHDEPRAPRSLNDHIPRDLQTACQKAMAKEPRRRYQTAGELAVDLRRFLRGEPILARPVSTWERWQRWAARNPAVAALSAALVVVFLLGFAGVLWKWQDAEAAREVAEEAARVAGKERKDAELARENEKAERLKAENAHAAAEVLRQVAEHAEKAEARERLNAERSLYINRIALADRYRLANNLARAEELLDACPPKLRAWEWNMLQRLCRQPVLTVSNTFGGMHAVAFSPDGKRVATGAVDAAFDTQGVVQVRDAETGQIVLHLRGHRQQLSGIAFAPTANQIATASVDETVRLWDGKTGRQLFSMEAKQGQVHAVAFSADGRRLASAHFTGQLVIWDPNSGKQLQSFKAHAARCECVAFHPDGMRIASGGADKQIKIWDANTGKELAALAAEAGEIYSLAFSPNGAMLASAHTDGAVILWNAETKEKRHTLREHVNAVTSVAFSPDGRQLASAGDDRVIRLWNTETGRALDVLRGHTERINAVAYSKIGKRLASAGDDPMLRLWDVAPHERPIWLQDVQHVVSSPDGLTLATAGNDAIITLWDVPAGVAKRTLKGHTSHVSALTFDATGRFLVSAGTGEALRVWDLRAQDEPRVLRDAAQAVANWCVAVSPRGDRVAAAGEGDHVLIWDVTKGTVQRTLRTSGVRVRSLAFDAEGKRLAAAADTIGASEFRVFYLENGKEDVVKTWYSNLVPANALAFTPDGAKLAAAGGKGVIQLWDPATGKQIGNLTGHSGEVWALAFSADGARLVSGGNEVKIWDVAGEQEIVTLAEPAKHVRFVDKGRRLIVAGTSALTPAGRGVPRLLVLDGRRGREQFHLRDAGLTAALSPNGEHLVSAGAADLIVLWDAAKGKKLATWEGHAEAVRRLAFSADGARVASASEDNTVKVWNVPAGQKPVSCAGHTDWVVHVAFSPDGKRLVSAGYDNTARVWNAATGTLLTTFNKHRERVLCVAFSADKQTVASAGDDHKVRLWNAGTGEELRVLEGHTDSVNAVAFSADGKWLASASDDRTVKLWKVATGEEARVLTGHHDYVRDVTFAPDDRFIATAGRDGLVIVWDAKEGMPVLKLRRPEGLRSIAYGPDGRVATAAENLAVRIWDTSAELEAGAEK